MRAVRKSETELLMPSIERLTRSVAVLKGLWALGIAALLLVVGTAEEAVRVAVLRTVTVHYREVSICHIYRRYQASSQGTL